MLRDLQLTFCSRGIVLSVLDLSELLFNISKKADLVIDSMTIKKKQ